MQELWQMYNKNKEPLDQYLRRGEQIPDGMYHLCVEVWTINRNSEVLLTQRNKDKTTFPLYWEATGGAVQNNETSKDAAIRELQEEVGLAVVNDRLYYLGDFRGDNWFMDSFVYLLPGDPHPAISLQPEEVSAAKWLPLNELSNEKEQIITGKVDRFLRYQDKIRALLSETIL
jgi:8-oxo-dGTP diphosphatase